MTRGNELAPAAAEWSGFLSRATGRRVLVRFGRSLTRVIVARRTHDGHAVRMHSGFAQAPSSVREAVASWLCTPVRRGRRVHEAPALTAWIDGLHQDRHPADLRPRRLVAQGRTHDLETILRDVAARDFAPEELSSTHLPAITWSERSLRSVRRSLRLGSYHGAAHLIRVHRVLDQPAVPRFFVAQVIFHELLHAIQPARRDARGRRSLHGPEFVVRERRHPDYERALAWQVEHLSGLIRSARTGRLLGGGGRASGARGILQRLLFRD
jgi:hypothetical protein